MLNFNINNRINYTSVNGNLVAKATPTTESVSYRNYNK